MRTIFLLCVAFALSIAVPEEEVAAAPETHLDEEQVLDKIAEKEPLPEVEVGEKILGDVKTNGCPANWDKYGSRCFGFVNRQLNWIDAEKYCLRYGANLASVHDQGEYDFLQAIVRVSTDHFPRAWIGGTDAIEGNNWLWSDGSAFVYQTWTTEPDNNHGNVEKCVVMNEPVYFHWGNVKCDLILPFICGTRPV